MYNALVFYQHKGLNMSCNLGVEDWRIGDKERIINATGNTQSIALFCLTQIEGKELSTAKVVRNYPGWYRALRE